MQQIGSKRKAEKDDKELIGYEPHGGLFSAPEKKREKKKKKKPAKAADALEATQAPSTSKQDLPLAEPPLEREDAVAHARSGSKMDEPKEEEQETLLSSEDEFHSASEADTKDEKKVESPETPDMEPANDSEAEEWTRQQLDDLSKGNKLGAQRRLHKLICEYFRPDQATGELVFLDDSAGKVRGSDIRRIVNFFVPLKNIHPKAKPNGIAAIIEILRLRKLNLTSLFPNESVKAVFAELANKPTAYQDRIKTLEQQRIQIKRIAEGLAQPDGSPAAASASDGGTNWTSFA